jgi:surface antigen
VVEPGIPSPAGALAGGVRASPGSCDAQGVCLAGDPFEVGQCTWYAVGRRPDLMGIVQGNAGGWLQAAAGRVPEGTTPVVGALAVWLSGRAPAGALGHVALVARVVGGRVLLDDSNWEPTPTSAPLQVHEHWVAAGAPSGYIYGGPAGAGPSR